MNFMGTTWYIMICFSTMYFSWCLSQGSNYIAAMWKRKTKPLDVIYEIQQQHIPPPVLPAAPLTLCRFSGHNSLSKPPIGLIFLAMGRGDKRTIAKTSGTRIDGVSAEKPTATSDSAGRSTAQNGRSSSREASSTVQDIDIQNKSLKKI